MMDYDSVHSIRNAIDSKEPYINIWHVLMLAMDEAFHVALEQRHNILGAANTYLFNV